MSNSGDNYGQYEVVMLPSVVVDLNIEIDQFHPDLQEKLAESGAADLDTVIPIIAAHVGIVMDGDYSLEDRIHIMYLCLERLKGMRKSKGGILILNSDKPDIIH